MKVILKKIADNRNYLVSLALSILAAFLIGLV